MMISEMPEAVKLSGEFRDLARKLAEALEESIQDTENSFREIRTLNLVSSATLEDDAKREVYTSEFKAKLESTNNNFCVAGTEKLKTFQMDLIKVKRYLSYLTTS